MWVVIISIIIIAMVGLIVHQMCDVPTIENKKIKNEESERRFLEEHNVIITKEYVYSDSYYENNISLSNCISVRFIVDQRHKKIVVMSTKDIREIIGFSDLIGAEIVIDSQVTGGVGRAVVGGVLAGGAGAVVGAMTAKKHIMSYKIVIYQKNLSNPKIEIPLIWEKKSCKDKDYLKAVEFSDNINATIRAIINSDSYDEIDESCDNEKYKIIVDKQQDKIMLIKAVRELQSISLAEANDIVERGVVCSGVSREEAVQLSEKYVQKGVFVRVVEDE